MVDASTRVSFIEVSGVKILQIDFSGTTPSEFIEVITHAEEIIGKESEKSLLTLTNVTDAGHDRRVSERVKVYFAHNKPFVRAGAVVGLNELKRIIFNFLNRATGRALKAFDDMDDAKSWLVRQG